MRVDERGRILIPKEFGVRSTRVVIIPAGSFFVVIPLAAEKAARRDAVGRARRRGQL